MPTIDRPVIRLVLLCNTHGRRADKPFRRINLVDAVEQTPQALRDG